MPFGKYKGKTIAFIRVRDTSYILWAADNVQDREVKGNCKACVRFIEQVDPFSLGEFSDQRDDGKRFIRHVEDMVAYDTLNKGVDDVD